MENGTSIAAGDDPQLAISSTVITLFSQAAKTASEWDRVAKEFFDLAHGLKQLSTRILGQNGPRSGRVLEMLASDQSSGSQTSPSLESCASTRRSQTVHDFEKRAGVEVIIQPLDLYNNHRTPGLAVFDMDSTLIQQEVIDELARSVGRYEQVAAVTEAAMRGELNFEESLQQRVAKLEGVSTSIWDYMKENVITFTPGAAELIKALKSLGWKTAVLSGGFTPLAYWVKDTLGLDYAYANQLATDESGLKLSGRLLPDAPIVGPSLKRETLLRLAEENKISISHTIAVGDGSNDLPMIGTAGLGIAFNAKPKVQEAAPARLNSKSLVDILHVFGFTSEDIVRYR